MAGKILLSDNTTEISNVASIKFKEAVNVGVDLRPGCVGSASIEVEVFGDQSSAPELGDNLFYYQVDSAGTQTLIGEFYAEPSIATKNSYKFVAYDAAQKLNADFSEWLLTHQADFPMTVYDLVSAACSVAGVTLGSAAWPMSDENVNAFYAANLTCRDILSYAAEIACRFVRCDTNGELLFAWYSATENLRIYPSAGESGGEARYAYKQNGLTYANYTTAALDRVAVHPPGAADAAYIYPEGESVGNTLHIEGNPLLTNASETFYSAVAYAVYTDITATGVYRPMRASLFPKENPFRAGDVVSVTDSQGVSFTSVVMSLSVTPSEATLESTGNEEYDSGANVGKAIKQLGASIDQLEQATTEAFENIRSQTSASIQTMQEQILSTVETTYYTQDKTDELLAAKSTEISQTAGDITFAFQTLLNDEANATDAEFQTLYSYIQMAGGTITLGKADSAVQLQIRNDGISILVDGEEVTYWQSDAFVAPKKLTVPEGGRFELGHYAYIPRSNGSLDFVWVGDDS